MALQNHPQLSTGPIVSNQRWPATSGAAPVFTPAPEIEIEINLGQSRVAATTAGPISYVLRFPYTSGAAPVFVPGIDDPSPPEEISKWLGIYPDWIDRRQIHAAYIPHASAWHVATPLSGDGFSWYRQPSEPVRQNHVPIAVLTAGVTRTILRVEIQPAMWLPVYPDYIHRTPQTRTGQQVFLSLQLATILPSIAAWQAQYPDFTRTAKPLYFLAPHLFAPDKLIPQLEIDSWLAIYPDFARTFAPNHFWQAPWFGPDTDRPGQPTEVDDGFVWFMQQPDFARGLPITHHLAPVLVWHTITGPNVRKPKRGGLLLMKVGS